MVLRNVPSTATFEEQRVEINELAADVNAITTDLVGDSSPQLGGDLELNGNDITGTGNISYNGNFAMGPNPGTNPKIFLNNNGTATFENTVIADGVSTSNNRLVVRTLNDEKFTVIGDGTVEIGGTPGTSPNIKLYASGSAEFAGGVDLAATNVNGSSINTFGGYTVQGSNGLRIVLDGYNQTTNTVRILTDGSATFAGNVSATVGSFTGNVTSARTSSSHTCFNGVLNGTTTSDILADGSATFNGNTTVGAPDVSNASTGGVQLFASGQLRIQRDGAGTATDKRFQMYYGTTETASITAAGAANFAGNVDSGSLSSDLFCQVTRPGGSQVTLGGSDDYALWTKDSKAIIKYDGSAQFASGNFNINENSTGSNFNVRNDSSSVVDAFAIYKGGFTSNDRTVLISNNGSAMFAGGNFAIGGTGAIAIDRASSGNFIIEGKLNSTQTSLIKADGSASFAETVSIGSGSASPDDYGLIAYASTDTLSNKSAVYARNLGGGRNFTGDNSTGSTTFEVYSSGSIVSTLSSSSELTSYNSVNIGGGGNRILLRTQANLGGDPYIKFDAGGSNMIVGEWYNGTTNNKLVLGVGEAPSSVQGLSIDGNGNGIYGNGHQSTALAVDADSNRGLNFVTSGRIYCKTDDHWDFNLVGGGLMMRFRNGNDNGSSAAQTVVGNITIQSNSVDFNTTQSDSRLKKNIESWSEGVLQHFKTLQPKKFHFNWQSDEESLETGYIAQDLVDIFPEAYPLCKTEIDGEEVNRYSFNPSGMVKYLMKALQEEIAKREELEARLDAAGL